MAERLPVTVIIPAFGRQALLDEAIASAAAQSALPEEVIVVDDGSPEPLRIDPAAERSMTVRLLRHDRNRGAAAARNTAILAANSEWIAFLDCDDTLTPGSLQARWEGIAARNGPQAPRAYCCDWIEFGGGKPDRLRSPAPAQGIADFASGCWFSPGSCLILHRPTLLETGVLQDEALRRLEDFDWFLELALRGYRLELQPVTGARIRRHRTQNPAKVEAAAAYIIAKWDDRGVGDPVRRRIRAYMMLECAAANRYARRWLRSFRFLAHSFAAVPRKRLQLSPGWRAPARHGGETAR